MIQTLVRLFTRAAPSITEAGLRDAEAIARLHAASFSRGWSEDEVERLLADRAVLAHRAMSGRSLCGFVLSRMAAGEAEILSVAVDSAARGKGLARKLLTLHLGRLAGLAIGTVFLEVEEDNEPARRLYRRAGFREVGQRKAYYRKESGQAAAALILRRDLA